MSHSDCPTPQTNEMCIKLDDSSIDLAEANGAPEQAIAILRTLLSENGGTLDLKTRADFEAAFPKYEPETPFVRALIIYDPVHPENHDAMLLDWGAELTVADYMGDLPDDISYEVCVNHTTLPKEMWALTRMEPRDCLVVIANPGGKGGGMMIAMIALMIVAAVVAPYLAGFIVEAGLIAASSAAVASTIIGGVITMVGGFIINSLMANNAKPKQAGAAGSDSSSPSYGLNGAKPTAEEGINVPVIYGEYRVAGNRTDFYVENSPDGKTQVIYLRYVVSEGVIDEFGDFEINEQPVSSFNDVSIEVRRGDMPEVPITWFNESLSPQTYNVPLSTTALVRRTTQEVDRVRVDVVFQGGLFTTDKKTGNRSDHSVGVYVTARNIATGTMFSLNDRTWSFSPVVGGTFTTPGASARAVVRVVGNANEPSTSRDIVVNFKRPGVDDWQNLIATTVLVQNNYVSDGYWAAGSYDIEITTPYYNVQADYADYRYSTLLQTTSYGDTAFDSNGQPDLPGGFLFEFSVPSYATIVRGETYTSTGSLITRNERNAFRASFSSRPLPRGVYDIYVNRGDNPSTEDTISDKVSLQDIVEIQSDAVNYNGTASYAVRMRLSDQLNAEPRITCKVRGRRVNIYDRTGQVVEYRYSNNPADIVTDILLSPRWNTGINPSRIDYASLAKWRAFCLGNGLTFNGVFETDTTIWDALQVVLRIGRANVALSGLKWSFIIEGPADPTMLFGQHNINKGTFENYWLNLEDRANQIEIQYYDHLDRNKRNSVFWTDVDSLAAGNPLRSNTVNLVGCTNRDQASREATLHVNLNRGIRQGVRFETFLDAISCAVGDVVHIQHDMPKWGWAGRIASVAWPEILIDEQLDGAIDPGDWRVLVLMPAVHFGNPVCSGVSGYQVRVYGNYIAARRLTINGTDYRVNDSVLAGSETVFVLDQLPAGVVEGSTVIGCWQTDVLREAQIDQPADGSSSVRVSLDSWGAWPQPQAGHQVMIGRYGKFKKPFRIVKIGRKTDHTFSIDAAEYNEEVYQPGILTHVPNYSELDGQPRQVQSLAVSQTQLLGDAGYRYFANYSWVRPLSDQRRYAGAHLFLRMNGGEWAHIGSPMDPTEKFILEVNVGDIAVMKVQAFYSTGETAPWDRAPTATFSPGAVNRLPDPPINLNVIGGIRLISATWVNPADPSVKSIEVWESGTNDQLTSYKVDEGLKNFFVRGGLLPLETRYYWIRSVSFSNVMSSWIGPVGATTSQLIASDIQDGIINTAKFAYGIAPVRLISSLSEGGTENDIAFNMANDKLYKFTGGVWVAIVRAIDFEGQLTNAQLADIAAAKITGQITVTQIADDSISTPKLSAGAVSTAKLAAGAVVADKIAAGSITSAKIEAGSIEAESLATNSITSDKITANSVVFGKVAAGAIKSEQIAVGEIRAMHIASETLITQTAQIGDLTVDRLHIKGGAISASVGATQYNSVTLYQASMVPAFYQVNLVTTGISIAADNDGKVMIVVDSNADLRSQYVSNLDTGGGGDGGGGPGGGA